MIDGEEWWLYIPVETFNLDREEIQGFLNVYNPTNSSRPSRLNMVRRKDHGDMERWAGSRRRSIRGMLKVQGEMKRLRDHGAPGWQARMKRLGKDVSMWATRRENPIYNLRYLDVDGTPPDLLHSLGIGTAIYAKQLIVRRFMVAAGRNVVDKEALSEVEEKLTAISCPPPYPGLTSFPKGFSTWGRMTGQQNFDLISYLPIAMALSPKADPLRGLQRALGELAYLHIQASRPSYLVPQLGADFAHVRKWAKEVACKEAGDRFCGDEWQNNPDKGKNVWVGEKAGVVGAGSDEESDDDEEGEDDDEEGEDDDAHIVVHVEEGHDDSEEQGDDMTRDDMSAVSARSDDSFIEAIEGFDDDAPEEEQEEGGEEERHEEEQENGWAGVTLFMLAVNALTLLGKEMKKAGLNMALKAKPGEYMHAFLWHIPLHGAWVYCANSSRFERHHKSLNLLLRCINWKCKLLSFTKRIEEWEVGYAYIFNFQQQQQLTTTTTTTITTTTTDG
jgi:hypothetical protein